MLICKIDSILQLIICHVKSKNALHDVDKEALIWLVIIEALQSV